jgi:phosphatidylglycerol:prolipoprotein diacylglycerol transferase
MPVASPGSIAMRPGSGGRSGATEASEAAEPEALVVSHWFDSGEGGDPYSATVRLTGRRVGVQGLLGPKDTFVQEDKVDDILPGTGSVSISSWIYGLQPGEWTVSGELIRLAADGGRSRGIGVQPLHRATWSWRRRGLSTAAMTPVKTRWALLAPIAKIPGVVPGSFTALAATAVLVALLVQSAILTRQHVAVGPSLVASMVAIVAGLMAAKLWHAVLHPGPWRQAILGGWAVDGFLVVAPIFAIAMLLLFGLPVGVVLDAATPGIFFAVAIGRWGCFFTGCCAGRCTTSRWGVWSSDRRVGARRIPTQILESAAGLLIGGVATVLVLNHVLGVDGLVFVLAFAAYALVRQFLLRLRAERRDYLWRRSSVIAGKSS